MGKRVVEELRSQLSTFGVPETKLTAINLRELWKVMPDVDLIVTACVMRPRPSWVRAILGPEPKKPR